MKNLSVPTDPKRDIVVWLSWASIAVVLLTFAAVFILSIRNPEPVRVPIGPVILLVLGALGFGVGFGMDLMSRQTVMQNTGGLSKKMAAHSQAAEVVNREETSKKPDA